MWSYKDIDLIEGCKFFLCKLSLINDVLLTKLITIAILTCTAFSLPCCLGWRGGGEGGGGNRLAHWTSNVFLQK